MFYQAKRANPNVKYWNVSNVENMSEMFAKSPLANPNVKYWNVSNVENMSNMFFEASSAQLDLSLWNFGSLSKSLDEFIAGTQIMPIQYTKLLIRLDATLPETAQGYTLSSGDIQYTEDGDLARNGLLERRWDIIDGGMFVEEDAVAKEP